MLPVARALQHDRVSKLLRHVAICRGGNILKTFLMKMGESSYMTKALICRRIIKKQCSPGKVPEIPRKTGRRRSTEWFERDFEDMPEAETYFRLIKLEQRNK